MIYVIRRSAVLQTGPSWIVNAVAFVTAALVGAVAVGAALGTLGGAILGGALQVEVSRCVAAAAIVVATLDLGGHRPKLLQWNRETSRTILERYKPPMAAVRNGLELGIGATSRIGFWLWYAVPVGAFMAATPILGALIYGSYGLARGVAPMLIMAAEARIVRADDREVEYMPRWLLRRAKLARMVAAAQLLAVGVAAGAL